MYVDALIDRDKDIIHVVERVNVDESSGNILHVTCSITKTVAAVSKVSLATNYNVW